MTNWRIFSAKVYPIFACHLIFSRLITLNLSLIIAALKDYILAPSAELPPGEYHVSVAAHNSLGWSSESFNRHRSGAHFVIVPALLGKSQALPLTGSASRLTAMGFFGFWLTLLLAIFVAVL